ncbi:MAG: hypothetical protein JJT77_13520 [Crocinitomicaceae bacterium]|nr:hypothetical protein [Crocinitomicaceae bacterium]
MIYGGLFLALVGIGFGCKKEDSNILNRNQNNTVKFDSFEDLHEKLQEIEKMSEEERRAYEKQNNNKSLLTHVYEVYEEIDMSKLLDLEPLHKHVKRYHDILEIIENNQGEKEYRAIYSDNPYSALAGKNRMIIIDTMCLKVFDDGLVITNVKNFDALNSLEFKSVEKVQDKKTFHVLNRFSNEFQMKSGCGQYREQRATSGSNRTKITIECYAKGNSAFIFSGEVYGLIRPYNRTLGVWFYAQRTITGQFQFDFAYEENGTNIGGLVGSGNTIVKSRNHLVSPTLAYGVARTFPIGTNGFYPSNYRFSSISSWGTTPNTSNATITCN